MVTQKFNVICADPPRPSSRMGGMFGRRRDGEPVGTPYYQLMTAEEIAAYHLPPLADSSVLHSTKPDVFYNLVESMLSGPYAELFARRKREGWTCYGDEL